METSWNPARPPEVPSTPEQLPRPPIPAAQRDAPRATRNTARITTRNGGNPCAMIPKLARSWGIPVPVGMRAPCSCLVFRGVTRRVADAGGRGRLVWFSRGCEWRRASASKLAGRGGFTLRFPLGPSGGSLRLCLACRVYLLWQGLRIPWSRAPGGTDWGGKPNQVVGTTRCEIEAGV